MSGVADVDLESRIVNDAGAAGAQGRGDRPRPCSQAARAAIDGRDRIRFARRSNPANMLALEGPDVRLPGRCIDAQLRQRAVGGMSRQESALHGSF
jgi:hypothetical protein